MRVRGAGAVVAVAAAVVLAGCGSSSGGGTAAAGSSSAGGGSAGGGSAGTAGGGTASAAAGGGGTQVTVDASEYALKLPSNTMAPGTYTFTMDNVGHATHAIEIEGPGVDKVKSSTAGPGGKATLTVTLQPGSYELWCPVGNHKQAGMDTTITVG
jgi:uncharacterized cupredoxin-like copper-binding protein